MSQPLWEQQRRSHLGLIRPPVTSRGACRSERDYIAPNFPFTAPERTLETMKSSQKHMRSKLRTDCDLCPALPTPPPPLLPPTRVSIYYKTNNRKLCWLPGEVPNNPHPCFLLLPLLLLT